MQSAYLIRPGRRRHAAARHMLHRLRLGLGRPVAHASSCSKNHSTAKDEVVRHPATRAVSLPQVPAVASLLRSCCAAAGGQWLPLGSASTSRVRGCRSLATRESLRWSRPSRRCSTRRTSWQVGCRGRPECAVVSQGKAGCPQLELSNITQYAKLTVRLLRCFAAWPVAARQSFKEQEAMVYQQLAQLIRDAVWLKSYIAAGEQAVRFPGMVAEPAVSGSGRTQALPILCQQILLWSVCYGPLMPAWTSLSWLPT